MSANLKTVTKPSVRDRVSARTARPESSHARPTRPPKYPQPIINAGLAIARPLK